MFNLHKSILQNTVAVDDWKVTQIIWKGKTKSKNSIDKKEILIKSFQSSIYCIKKKAAGSSLGCWRQEWKDASASLPLLLAAVLEAGPFGKKKTGKKKRSRKDFWTDTQMLSSKNQMGKLAGKFFVGLIRG